jgi:hypothetical protein
MELAALARTVIIDRLVALEDAAAHAAVLAAVADNAAWRARQEADAAQATLSAVKIFLALLPENCRLELRAPKLNAEAPADRLGVRLRLPAPPPDRGIPSCPAHTTFAPASSAPRPASREMTPRRTGAPGAAPG